MKICALLAAMLVMGPQCGEFDQARYQVCVVNNCTKARGGAAIALLVSRRGVHLSPREAKLLADSLTRYAERIERLNETDDVPGIN